jgi:elongation factor P--(R)-beta-lysine ligase
MAMLRLRAQVLQKIRGFFAERCVLEVETPMLCATVGTDPNLAFFTTEYQWLPKASTLYLQTSPEFAMKRLLASGSGSIYQICKAFRNGESGRYHNPEFTLLEWYRVGFDLTQLMDEVAQLLNILFAGQLNEAVKISYQRLYTNYTGLDCLTFDFQAYCRFANNHPQLRDAKSVCGDAHDQWLDFIFSQCIQPFLTGDKLYLVHGYPACLSSLARLNANNPLLTDRVEVFMNGVELGNGYHELADAVEQAQRFSAELAVRQTQQLPIVGKDERLLAALNAGLPDCAGIALGLDRILMLLAKSGSIDETMAFPIHKA